MSIDKKFQETKEKIKLGVKEYISYDKRIVR